MDTGILYIVSTPIGNLEDISLRAIRVLNEVDFIACEDTRVTQKLLNHYEIKTKTFSYHKFSERQKTSKLIELLQEGKNIALVSDAGTPLISDPGSILIKQLNETNIKAVPVPGACAAVTAMSAFESETPEFAFIGFLPKSKNEKKQVLAKFREINIIFYESPNRLVKTLSEINELFEDSTAMVTRELTKMFEELKTDKIGNLIKYYQEKPPKGEITVILKAKKIKNKEITPEVVEKIEQLQKEGFSSKDISKIVAMFTGVSKNKIYKEINPS